ncbi:uncharacterized protein LOC101738110 [Bombyx mori]|uniref:Cytosolic endo-beta-N-acetylglucosaminidase TIM barrel domain-containing protein n=1 Tax=Bombyx mori TaxID=7091 RepID=A0A8R1WGU4_BOMMO|nr:uncharacterized protein LOC101738110 [Bombyx mori]
MNSKTISTDSELTCKPLDSYEELISFLEDPPAWSTLCKEMTPHSKALIKNTEVNKSKPHSTIASFQIQTTEDFCHFNPDTENETLRHDKKKTPKTLVCHDMANGYHDDSTVDGTGCHHAYTFYNWAAVDIFCYFSHHLITIPPLSWINVGHAHGVKVIGTVITEWNDGVAFWNKMLASEAVYRYFASALVSVAKVLKFDGWLLNIENQIAKPEMLLDFVRYFHRILHQELDDPVLIWYDSVTIQGTLIWQNGLNHKNRPFFDACDGIFTNYSWSEANVSSSAVEAGDRLTDLYIGIDVWGRNFYGGGQLNTQSAVKIAHKYGCSMAIFAPAWSHEAMSLEDCNINRVAMTEGVDTYRQFLLRDRALWGTIWPYLNTRLPCELPFRTSFCRGQGLKRRLYGEVLGPVPWYNLRHMQYQPNSTHGAHGYFISALPHILRMSKNDLLKDPDALKKMRKLLNDDEAVRSMDLPDDARDDVPIDEFTDDDDNVISDEKFDDTDNGSKDIKRKLQISSKSNAKASRLYDVKENAVNSSSHSTVTLKINKPVDKTQYALACVPGELECLELYLDDSFTGGSCLKVNPSDAAQSEHRFIRLFHCDFTCEEKLIACVVTKNLKNYPEQNLNVKLFMKDQNDRDLKVVLVGRSLSRAAQSVASSSKVNLYPVNGSSDEGFRDLQKYILLNEPEFYVPVDNAYNWRVRYYEISLPGTRITSINLRTTFSEGPILLGHFGLCARKSDL